MNEKLKETMRAYDQAAIGTEARAKLGIKLEKEGSKLSERDYWRLVTEYEKERNR